MICKIKGISGQNPRKLVLQMLKLPTANDGNLKSSSVHGDSLEIVSSKI